MINIFKFINSEKILVIAICILLAILISMGCSLFFEENPIPIQCGPGSKGCSSFLFTIMGGLFTILTCLVIIVLNKWRNWIPKKA